MKKEIIKIPSRKPKNPLVALTLLRPGAGSHHKTSAQLRKKIKNEIKKELDHFQ